MGLHMRNELLIESLVYYNAGLSSVTVSEWFSHDDVWSSSFSKTVPVVECV